MQSTEVNICKMPNAMFCVLHTIINYNGERQRKRKAKMWSAMIVKATEEIKTRERRKVKERVVHNFK